MFAPMILPVQLTCIIFLILAVLVASWPGRAASRRRRIACFALLTPIAFIASCVGISVVVDAGRYGKFEYAKASQIRDSYIHLPPAATDITVLKSDSRHYARFTVEPDRFREWLDDEWIRAREFMTPVNSKPDYDSAPEVGREQFEAYFRESEWDFLPDLHEYRGPTSARGGGFTAYYSRSRQIAYLWEGYW